MNAKEHVEKRGQISRCMRKSCVLKMKTTPPPKKKVGHECEEAEREEEEDCATV